MLLDVRLYQVHRGKCQDYGEGSGGRESGRGKEMRDVG